MAVHLITATPMLNRGSDYYGYLTLFWRDEFDVSEMVLYGDFEFDRYDDTHIPEHTPIYEAGGELDYGKFKQPMRPHNPKSLSSAMIRKEEEGRCLEVNRK